METFVIIHKERETTQQLIDLVESFGSYLCVGSERSFHDGLNVILKENPSILFVDMDATELNPISFVHELMQYKDELPELIGLAKDRSAAFEALKNGFFDLSLLPLVESELRKTMIKLQKKKSTKSRRTLCLKSNRDFKYLNTADILYLRADNNTTDFYLSNGKVISGYKTLKCYQEVLPKDFVRVHRSYIINSKHVSRIQFGKLTCTIDDTQQVIPISKSYLDNINYMNDVLSQYSISTK